MFIMTSQAMSLMSRFLRFAVVGGSGVFVNLGIYYLLSRGFGLRGSWGGRIISYALSVEFSILSNFMLNDVWTFADRREGIRWIKRLFRFHLVSFVGFGVNWGVFAALNYLMLETGFEILGNLAFLHWHGNVDDLIAACTGIIAAMAWNFFGNLLWTWRSVAR